MKISLIAKNYINSLNVFLENIFRKNGNNAKLLTFIIGLSIKPSIKPKV